MVEKGAGLTPTPDGFNPTRLFCKEEAEVDITQFRVMFVRMEMKKAPSKPAACPSKPALSARRLLSPAQARNLTVIFKALANPTRARLLHALVKEEELGVNELCAAIGMKPQAVSNQLQRLAARGIVEARRNGNQILYRIVDPCVPTLLDQGLCLAEDAQNRKR